MAQWLTQPLTEMNITSRKEMFLESKMLLSHNANNLTAISEPTV
jgi:hypothetical protein